MLKYNLYFVNEQGYTLVLGVRTEPLWTNGYTLFWSRRYDGSLIVILTPDYLGVLTG